MASLEIVGDTLLDVGASTTLRAIARTSDGSPVSAPPIDWTSLDEMVARVAATGEVTGLQPGEGRIVAEADQWTDTFTVRVDMPALGLGDVVGWITDPSGVRPFGWVGQADVYDVMAGTDGDTGRLLIDNAGEPGTRDSIVLVSIPSSLSTGAEGIGAFPLDGSAPAGVVAALLLGQGGPDAELFYSLDGGTLTLADLAYPPRPGLEFGEATGQAEFQAVRHEAGPGGRAVPTADTVDVHLEFRLWLQHLIRPRVSATLTGGPVDGAVLAALGQTYVDGGVLEAWWDADLDGVPGQPWRYEAQQAFVSTTTVGTRSVEAITASEYADPGLWPSTFSAIYYRDDPRMGLSVAGTIEVTRYLAPTTSYFGELEGTFSAEHELWDAAGNATGVMVSSEASFAIPVNPIGAAPG